MPRKPQVIVELDVFVERPCNVGEATKERGTFTISRLNVCAAEHGLVGVAHEFRSRTTGRVEHLQRPHMHGMFAGLPDQKQRVGWRYRLHDDLDSSGNAAIWDGYHSGSQSRRLSHVSED